MDTRFQQQPYPATLIQQAKFDPRALTPHYVLQLQRTIGNQAAGRLLVPMATQHPAYPARAVQRRNGATPQNFAATNTAVIEDNDECAIQHGLTWESSTGNLDDLDDYLTREIVTFNQNPVTVMPAYGGPLPAGMVVNANVMTKLVSSMDRPGGVDRHSGAGNGTGFTIGGQPNLQKAAWQLIGTQYYQVSSDGGANWNNILGPFTITRTMQQVGTQYTLTISKTGPGGINLSAGPTPIYDYLTSEAIANVGPAAPDQTAGWNLALASITTAGLIFANLATDMLAVGGAPIQVTYEKTHPANPTAPNMANYILPDGSKSLVLGKARDAINNIITKVPNLPPRMIVTLIQGHGFGPTSQQAFLTNENGGTYRVLLRVDKIVNLGQHMAGSVAGQYSRGAWTEKGKKRRYAQAVMTHETGHLLHAFTNPDFYKIATMSQMNYQPDPTDPLDAQKAQISRINTDVMMALNGRPYSAEWGYAKNPMQANPAEVVAEVFTALSHGRTVPRGLAAVYLAYGGMRSPQLDAQLQAIFGGAVPTITQPQNTIPIIQND